MTMPARPVKLTVFNDLICPNCCIGQHELLSAIAYAQNVQHLNLKFEIEFMPFRLVSTTCLNDDMPKVDKTTFFSTKLGAENYNALESAITKWGEEKGIHLKFSGPMSQSTRAHRLSRKAYLTGGQQFQLPLLCALFKANLEQGKDIADFDTLADIAEQTGVMSREEAIKFLKSDELEDEVNKLIEEAKEKGVKGVPFLVIDGKWALEGGQSSEVFLKIFSKLEMSAVNSAPSHIPSPPQKDNLPTPMSSVC